MSEKQVIDEAGKQADNMNRIMDDLLRQLAQGTEDANTYYSIYKSPCQNQASAAGSGSSTPSPTNPQPGSGSSTPAPTNSLPDSAGGGGAPTDGDAGPDPAPKEYRTWRPDLSDPALSGNGNALNGSSDYISTLALNHQLNVADDAAPNIRRDYDAIQNSYDAFMSDKNATLINACIESSGLLQLPESERQAKFNEIIDQLYPDSHYKLDGANDAKYKVSDPSELDSTKVTAYNGAGTRDDAKYTASSDSTYLPAWTENKEEVSDGGKYSGMTSSLAGGGLGTLDYATRAAQKMNGISTEGTIFLPGKTTDYSGDYDENKRLVLNKLRINDKEIDVKALPEETADKFSKVISRGSGDTGTKAVAKSDDAVTSSKATVDPDFHNKFHPDMTAYANMALQTFQTSYANTEYVQEKNELKRVARLFGVGGASGKAAVADLRYDLMSIEKIDVKKALGANGSKFVAGCGNTSNKVLRDYNNNVRLVDNYLYSKGINAGALSRRDIDRMLRTGEMKGKYGEKVALDVNTKTILEEKRNMLENKGSVADAQRGSGRLKSVASAWVQEGLDGTYAADGIRNAKTAAAAVKIGATITKASVGGVAIAGVKSLELTGRLGIKAAQGAANVGLGVQRIFISGDKAAVARSKKFTQNMNKKFKAAGSKVKVAGHSATSRAAWMTKTNGRQKVHVLTNAGKSLVGRTRPAKSIKAGVGGLKNKFLATRVGRVFSRIGGGFKAFNAWKKRMQEAILRHTRFIRAPFTLGNRVKALLRKLAMKAAAGFLFLCMICACLMVPMVGFLSVIPEAFLALGETNASAAVTKNVGQEAIDTMLIEQVSFLSEMGSYYDSICTLRDQYGNKLHPSHTAYYSVYYGAEDNSYDSLVNGCNINTSYGISVLYKTIISMATVATGNEAADSTFYSAYCTQVLEKVLHTAEHSDANGTVPIRINAAALINSMWLDPTSLTCGYGCGQRFVATDNTWMHDKGANSLEYSEWRRTSQNYNTWLGWITEDHASYEWAYDLWTLSEEDWANLNVILPGTADFGATFGGKPLNTTQYDDVLAVVEANTDDASRIAAVQSALDAFQSGILYSQDQRGNTRTAGAGLTVYQDCSSFCWNNLVNAGVVSGTDWAYTTDTFVHSSVADYNVNLTTEFKPGDILVRWGGTENSHALMFLGYTEDGRPMTIDCGGSSSASYVEYAYNDCSICVYDSIGDMINKRHINYVCDFFD